MGIDPYTMSAGALYVRTLSIRNPAPEAFEGHIGDPPTWLMLLEPFTLLPPGEAYWLWTVLSLAAFATSLVMLFRESRLDKSAVWVVASFMVMYPPIAVTLWHGKGDLFLLLLFVLFGSLIVNGREGLAGATLGIAGGLRGYPLGMCLYLIARKKWRALAATAAAFFFVLVLTIGIVGRGPVLDYYGQTSLLKNGAGLFTDTPPLHQPIGWVRHPSNLNLGWAAKFAFDHLIDVKRHPHLHAARALTAMLAETVLLGLAFWITVARRAGGSDDEWAHISLWIVTVTMVAPLFWSDFLDCFVVYFVVFSAAFWRGRASRFSIWTCFGAYLTAIASAISGSHSVSVFIRDTMFRGHVRAYNWLGELLFVSVLLTWISAWSLASVVSPSDTTTPPQSRRIRLSRIPEASA